MDLLTSLDALRAASMSETELQAQIEEYFRDRDWFVFQGRSDRAGLCRTGYPLTS